jgi:hypothetical protein
LCGAPDAGDHDAEYHGDLAEQNVRPLHDLSSDFSCAGVSLKALHRGVAGVRIGSGLVPVKDRSQHNGRGKRKNERGGESKKSAASESALRRIQSSKQVTQKSRQWALLPLIGNI